MNLSIYGLGNRHQRSWLAVDLGVSFGDEEHLPGIDTIMPDIGFLEKERKNLIGLVLTHAHEDHFGAIIDLWPRLKCPIYATKFSAALFEAKCASERNPPKIPVTVVASGSRIDLGPFNVEFHSGGAFDPGIPCAGDSHRCGHGIAYRRLEDRSDANHRRADRRAAVARARRCRRAGADGRFHQCGAGRALAVGDRSCQDHHRTGQGGKGPGRGDHLCVQRRAAARGRGTPPASAGARWWWSDAPWSAWCRWRAKPAHLDGVQNFRGADLYGHFPPDKVLALCTGSQGEPRAALSRIANDDHPQVTLNKGDCVIFSSRTIPGNERAVGAIINGLVTQGIEVINRSHPPRPCVRTSAPRRTARHDRLGSPAIADPRPWRGAASVRARQAGAGRGRAQGSGLPQRRSGQTGPRRSRRDRAVAVGATLQGTARSWRIPNRARWSNGAGWPLPVAPSWRSR